MTYEKPSIADYGNLVELTEATSFTDAEDGGNKLVIHHTTPSGA